MNRRLGLLVPTLAVIALAPAAALAHGDESHDKHMTEKYTASAPVPNPSGCNGLVPSSQHVQAMTTKLSGMLHVEISGFAGNWDAWVVDSTGKRLAGAGSPSASKELIQVMVKKNQKLSVVACNIAGTSTATVRYGVLDAKAHAGHGGH